MRKLSLGVLGVLFAGPAGAATLDIAYSPLAPPYAERAPLFEQAESFWESRITGYRDGIAIERLSIDVNVLREEDDFLARASPRRTASRSGSILPLTGFVEINEIGFERLAADRDLTADALDAWLLTTIIHETGHVLGFGTLWGENDLYARGSGAYTGAAGLAAYRAEFDPGAEYVPVERDYGPATADAHWSWTAFAGGQGELMQGYVSPGAYLSDTTLGAFRDLGYATGPAAAETPAIAAIPAPPSVSLGLSGIGALALARTRRRVQVRAAAGIGPKTS